MVAVTVRAEGLDRRRPPSIRPILAAPTATKLYWTLRVGVAAEFFGHAFAGLVRGPWLPYYELFGISPDFAWNYMFYVTAAVDLTAAFLTLFFPIRLVLLYTAVWGTFTAFLRPAAGESWFETLERGGNYAMPAALLVLAGWGGWSLRRWLTRAAAPGLAPDLWTRGVLDYAASGMVAVKVFS